MFELDTYQTLLHSYQHLRMCRDSLRENFVNPCWRLEGDEQTMCLMTSVTIDKVAAPMPHLHLMHAQLKILNTACF